MRKVTLIGLLALVGFPLLAQDLSRKGSLGVSYFQNLPDSISVRLNYKIGAVVKSLVPNSTASSLQLQPFDIITSINQQDINSPARLAAVAKTLRGGDPIELKLIRDGKLISLSGKVVPKPFENNPIADVTYGSFKYGSGQVRTIYASPKGKKPAGTIYFLQGLPCYSMDNFTPLDKTKQALDEMVNQGYAVYRMEKGDMGDNTGIPPCETMGFHDELKMYEAGYQNLLKMPGVDHSKIFLFGHSMGGVVAPLLAEKFQPTGVVVYGTVFKPWAEYLLDAYKIQLQYFGEDLAVLRDSIEFIKPKVYEFFYGKASSDQIAATPEGLLALQMLLSYDPVTKLGVSGRTPQFHKEINQYNTCKAWGNTRSHVLAIYGECDLAANNADDHQALVAYINKKNPGKASFWQAEGSTHTFEKIGSMDTFIRMQSNPTAYYQYAASRFNPAIFEYVCKWMTDIAKKG